ncbi:retrotransposon protein, putative, ty1-copia subclass [Tanacetum coccineum]
MMTYLKQVGNYKHSELKIKKFEKIQALYEKIKRSDKDFISIGSAEDEKLIKRMNEKGVSLSKSEVIKEESKEEVQEEDKDEESTRKRKLGTRKKIKSRKRRYIQNTSEDDSDKENDELRLYLTIAQDEEKEVDYEILDRKYPIKEWKTECLGAKPQTDQAEHLEEINLNVDLNVVYQLVMDRFLDEIPEGFERVLWGDLMVMFNPDDESEFSGSQQDWKIVSWKLHSSSGVHTLVTETGLVVHMLVEKKYPLRKEVLMQMLKLKLESEEDSTMALELIKFVKKILAELEPEDMSPPRRQCYRWNIAFATGCRRVGRRKRTNRGIRVPAFMRSCRIEEELTLVKTLGKEVEEYVTKVIAKDGTVTRFEGRFPHFIEEEEEKKPKPYNLYGFVDLMENEQMYAKTGFAPHRIPQSEGNHNGWLSEEEEADSDSESTASLVWGIFEVWICQISQEISQKRTRERMSDQEAKDLKPKPEKSCLSLLQSATRILNMVPTKKVKRTPYKIWHGKAPKLSYLRVWGCEALVKRDMIEKLDPRSIKCIFVGYPKETMASGSHGLLKSSGSDGGIELIQEEDTQPSENTSEIHNEVAPIEEFELGDLNEPPNYKAALSDPEFDKWLEAINTKMQSMKDNQVTVLVDLPPNGQTVGSKWLFKKKTNMDGNVHTFKARLVAKGYTQTYGVDYEETFSPVVNIRNIRILLAIAVFLNGHLSEWCNLRGLWIQNIPTKYANFNVSFMD